LTHCLTNECNEVLHCATVCCSVLQCVAVCCSVLQCAAVVSLFSIVDALFDERVQRMSVTGDYSEGVSRMRFTIECHE